MIAIIALSGEQIEYDPKEKKVYIKLEFYGQYTSICSIFTTPDNTIEEAKNPQSRSLSLSAKSMIANTNGAIKISRFRLFWRST